MTHKISTASRSYLYVLEKDHGRDPAEYAGWKTAQLLAEVTRLDKEKDARGEINNDEEDRDEHEEEEEEQVEQDEELENEEEVREEEDDEEDDEEGEQEVPGPKPVAPSKKGTGQGNGKPRREVKPSAKAKEAAETAAELRAAGKPASARVGDSGKRGPYEGVRGAGAAKAKKAKAKEAGSGAPAAQGVTGLADVDRDLLVGLNLKFEELRKRVDRRDDNLDLDIADQIAGEQERREVAKNDIADKWRDMNPGDPGLRKRDDRDFQLSVKLLNLTAAVLRDFQGSINHWERSQRLGADIKASLDEIIGRIDEVYGSLLLAVTDSVEVALAFRRGNSAFSIRHKQAIKNARSEVDRATKRVKGGSGTDDSAAGRGRQPRGGCYECGSFLHQRSACPNRSGGVGGGGSGGGGAGRGRKPAAAGGSA